MMNMRLATCAVLFVLFQCVQSFTRTSMPGLMMRTCSRTQSRGQMDMRWGLKTSAPQNGLTADGKLLRDSVPFELRGFSLPLVVFSAGVLLTASSFAGFFLNEGGSDGAVSSLGFVYGIPVFLIGLSLWYAEIPPVQVIADEEGEKAWEEFSSDTFQKIKQDVTRHRYGDDAHLDSTLESLGLKLPQKKYPKLLSLTQARASNGQLSFTLTFQSIETPFKIWNEPARLRRYEVFFGPNVKAEVAKVDAGQRIVSLTLTTIPEDEYKERLKQPIQTANIEAEAEEGASSSPTFE